MKMNRQMIAKLIDRLDLEDLPSLEDRMMLEQAMIMARNSDLKPPNYSYRPLGRFMQNALSLGKRRAVERLIPYIYGSHPNQFTSYINHIVDHQLVTNVRYVESIYEDIMHTFIHFERGTITVLFPYVNDMLGARMADIFIEILTKLPSDKPSEHELFIAKSLIIYLDKLQPSIGSFANPLKEHYTWYRMMNQYAKRKVKAVQILNFNMHMHMPKDFWDNIIEYTWYADWISSPLWPPQPFYISWYEKVKYWIGA